MIRYAIEELEKKILLYEKLNRLDAAREATEDLLLLYESPLPAKPAKFSIIDLTEADEMTSDRSGSGKKVAKKQRRSDGTPIQTFVLETPETVSSSQDSSSI